MRLLLISSLTAFFIVFANAQDMSNHPMPRVINGKIDPTAIPDHVAYRMVLVSFTIPSSSPTAIDLKRQNLHLKALGLSDAETQDFREILRNFRLQHEQWQAKQRNGTARGSHAFKKQLVQDTRAAIARVLSPGHLAAFDLYVQSHKKYIVTTEVQ